MTKELEAKLVQKYPRIFRDYGGDMRVTCMHWGMAHGDGWYGILDALCGAATQHLDPASNRPAATCDFYATQVKEKFGTLRFYFDGGDAYIEGLVDMAEAMSERTCETCGAPGRLTKHGGYLRTECESCESKRLEARKEETR